MVYDIFTFFYELDLLELRLNILNDYVDYFVIVEATESFIGESKQLYYNDNKERFSKWSHKIIHYVVDDYPNDLNLLNISKKSPNVGNGEHWWVREFYQKESIKKALINLNDDDICIISDVDEIWNPKISFDLNVCDLYRPTLSSYLYYLNYRSNATKNMFTGPIIAKYKTIKENCLNHLRNRSMTTFIEIDNGGWHFEAFGGINGASLKINIVKHPDYYNQNNLNNNLENRLIQLQDYKGRQISAWKDDTNLPSYVNENWEKIHELGYLI